MPGSEAWSSAITGQVASWTILLTSCKACSELTPSPTSGCSRRCRSADLGDLDFKSDHFVAERVDDRREVRETINPLIGDHDAKVFGWL